MTALNFRIAMPTCHPSNRGECEQRFVPLIMALETLTRINQWHFRSGRAVSLADSRAVYREEPPGREDWDDCVTVASRGWGDCEDLAAYLCAELRELHGIRAECVIRWRFISADEMKANGYPARHIPKDGVFLVHVLVRLPDGSVIDPSKMLGMRGDFN